MLIQVSFLNKFFSDLQLIKLFIELLNRCNGSLNSSIKAQKKFEITIFLTSIFFIAANLPLFIYYIALLPIDNDNSDWECFYMFCLLFKVTIMLFDFVIYYLNKNFKKQCKLNIITLTNSFKRKQNNKSD